MYHKCFRAAKAENLNLNILIYIQINVIKKKLKLHIIDFLSFFLFSEFIKRDEIVLNGFIYSTKGNK